MIDNEVEKIINRAHKLPEPVRRGKSECAAERHRQFPFGIAS